jgi:hypothetical protein
MTTKMEENEMNEFSQIRERFLAETRQHFFAEVSTTGKMQSASRQNNNPCRTGTDETRCGQSGI